MFQPGQGRYRDVTFALHLLDISLTGARAHAATPPPIGTLFHVECGFALGSARVAWHDGTIFGLRFSMPLTMEMIDRVAGAHVSLRNRIRELPPIS